MPLWPDRSADGGFAILPSTPLSNSNLNRRSVNAGVIPLCIFMSSRSLEERIEEDLAQSGFASELRAFNSFLDNDWAVQASPQFEDFDEGKWREYDIKASKLVRYQTDAERIVATSLQVTIEVKKSDKPWVVLRRRGSLESRLRQGGRAWCTTCLLKSPQRN